MVLSDIEIRKLFGKKIKSLREKENMSQEELSVKLNLTQRQISMIERGLSFPKFKTLYNIADIFNCGIQDMFDNDYLQSEEILKNLLKNIIDNSNYEKTKTIYLIAKNL